MSDDERRVLTDDERRLTAEMMDEERRSVAVHESAHAIMELATGMTPKRVSIVPDSTTLGRVTARRDRFPEPRVSLILGVDPESKTRLYHWIMVFLAGTAAEDFARGYDVVVYPPYVTDYQEAERLALAASGSSQEGYALLAWLRMRTADVVSGPYFKRLQDQLVPILLERDELSEAEVLEILRPIADEVLDIRPKTRRGRLRLRWLRLLAPARRAFRRRRRSRPSPLPPTVPTVATTESEGD